MFRLVGLCHTCFCVSANSFVYIYLSIYLFIHLFIYMYCLFFYDSKLMYISLLISLRVFVFITMLFYMKNQGICKALLDKVCFKSHDFRNLRNFEC